jgi:hypothetical protein
MQNSMPALPTKSTSGKEQERGQGARESDETEDCANLLALARILLPGTNPPDCLSINAPAKVGGEWTVYPSGHGTAHYSGQGKTLRAALDQFACQLTDAASAHLHRIEEEYGKERAELRCALRAVVMEPQAPSPSVQAVEEEP